MMSQCKDTTKYHPSFNSNSMDGWGRVIRASNSRVRLNGYIPNFIERRRSPLSLVVFVAAPQCKNSIISPPYYRAMQTNKFSYAIWANEIFTLRIQQRKETCAEFILLSVENDLVALRQLLAIGISGDINGIYRPTRRR